MFKRDKNFNKRIKQDFSYNAFESDNVAKEKQRARDLRSTPWWRKKISTGLCHYCGLKFNPKELTMDHKIPLARGGSSNKENLVPACKDCNNKKKNLLSVEWDSFMKSLEKLEN